MTIPPGGQSTSPSWPGLMSGRLYSISLVAMNDEGEAAGYINLQINSPPTEGSIEISPSSSSLVALSPFFVSLGDGWTDADTPISVTFGIRAINSDGSSSVSYLPSSLSTSSPLVLPSATVKGRRCGDRVAYSIIAEVCDRLFACSSQESSPFIVAQSSNLTATIATLTQQIDDEIDNGNNWVALRLLEAIRAETCADTMDTKTADKIISSLVDSVDESSDSSEYRQVMTAVTRTMSSLSPPALVKAFTFVGQYQRLMGIETASSLRRKRSTTAPPSTNDDTLLPYFDTLLKMNISTSLLSGYFPTIEAYLSASCAQLDESTPRIITQTGKIFTTIQAQALVPASTNFVSTKFTVAGASSGVISFDSSVVSAFSRWNCDSSSQCLLTCLGSYKIAFAAVTSSHYLQVNIF
ncbi:hypothetical protein PFISCL1PPCAC_26135 [Pristionchus fissidentatus]|uniref:PKD/REJ-like domain-containing protein n=1 Tax=Pristionchus fissidentatus TaxID=1538716 RepID=A0AAV5WVY3_9BILA|nr:hypothetical protein PFISCL1PPCAC_26135 [Pristionchus fissidentatus]